MNNEQPLLTVSIPTWNRCKLVSQLLDELIDQIHSESLQDTVRIVVSNNASTDNTRTAVLNRVDGNPFIFYSENDTNTGAKSNVLKSIELAPTPFVLFIGDDDRIRKGALKEIIGLLKEHPSAGLFLDTKNFRWKRNPVPVKITVTELLENYYWLIGNAGYFVTRTEYFKENLREKGYDFFNECWPQTQIIILGLNRYNHECIVADLGIPGESAHDDVMMYNSFYLWRTCYYELTVSINTVENFINRSEYKAARFYLRKSLTQQVFNILQCGIFVDNDELRNKTVKHIFHNLHLFTAYEKIMLVFISIILRLPLFITRPFANAAIFLLKGRQGIRKKNDFVENELRKKKLAAQSAEKIRNLEFEKD